VLIIGAGGLGSPASLYLTSAGVGKITIVDGDTVDLTKSSKAGCSFNGTGWNSKGFECKDLFAGG